MNGRDEELLSAYFDGELPDDEKSRAEQLLTENVAAREVLDEVAEVSGWLRELPRPAAPHGLHSDVLARIRNAAAPRPLPVAAPVARPTWRRQASWAAVSVVGLLLAVVLYRAWPSRDAERPAGTAVALNDHYWDAGSRTRESAGFEAAEPVDMRSFEYRAEADDPVQVAVTNSNQFQDQLARLLERGDPPVAGEERADLAQLGDQVVVITYRVVDTETLPGEVQFVLTQNGIASFGDAPTDSKSLADAHGDGELEAFYVEAPVSNFTSAVNEFAAIDGVTTVTTNFVAVAAAPASGEDAPREATAAESASRFSRLSATPSNGTVASSNQPAAPASAAPATPLSASRSRSDPESLVEHDAQAQLGIEGKTDQSAPIPVPLAAYQVVVPARQELVEELQQQAEVAPGNARDLIENGRLDKTAPQQQSKAVLRRNFFVESSREQGPPPPPHRVRAVIVLVPEKAR